VKLDKEKIKEQIYDQIRTVFDPEIPVDIYVTLTSPACPVAESLPMEVQEKAMSVEGVIDVDLRVVFDPPWSKDLMSEDARFALDMM